MHYTAPKSKTSCARKNITIGSNPYKADMQLQFDFLPLRQKEILDELVSSGIFDKKETVITIALYEFFNKQGLLG
jgi:hypothetical protein